MNSNIIIGIDLGTTNSLVSYIKNGSPRIIPNPRGARMTPSVVFIKENGEVIVGELAKNQAVLNGEQTVSNVKLAMGKDREYTIHNRKYSPSDISALILSHLKEYAQQYLGCPLADAVITVPAYFDDRQREDTLKAAEKAGLNVLKLLNEPTAAALTFGFSQKGDARFLVVDFGGGTLDITLMEYKDRVFRVRGVGGSTAIGGSSLDRRIVDYILKDVQDTYNLDLRKDPIAFQQLMIHGEKAKTDLSSTDETRIMIPYITLTDKGPLHLNLPLHRERFELLIRDELGEIEKHIRRTFETSGRGYDWPDSLILVGGSTRLPVMEKLLRKIINKGKTADHPLGPETDTDKKDIVKKNINPDEAVARGAGILAGILEGSLKNIEFHDITPYDLGVEDEQGNFVPLIPGGTPYPAEEFRLFTTTQDFQEEVCIHVLQKPGKEENYISLGQFRLQIEEPRKKGENNIDVNFSINTHGLLNVSALDIESGKMGEILIEEKEFMGSRSTVQVQGAENSKEEDIKNGKEDTGKTRSI